MVSGDRGLAGVFRIIVIGGGGTGAAILHDLTQRGFHAVLLERGELTSGTTGRHHGQLHSGARYAVTDPEAAEECIRENRILRSIAPGALEQNDGLFVALTEKEEAFCDRFLEACEACAIPAAVLTASRARALEPNLHPDVRFAVQVPDGTLDAWRLPLMFFASARSGGAEIRTFSRVTGLERNGARVTGVKVLDLRTNREYSLPGDLVINAAGPWAGQVASMAGVDLDVRAVPGVMVAVKGRLANMVISRLDLPGDGDILVPQRNLSIVGTTSWIARDPDVPPCPEDHVRMLLDRGAEMVPAVREAPFRAAWAAARPLIGDQGSAGGRGLSRTFRCYDHARDPDPLEGFVSVTGGKATTLRAMAEKTVDRVCRKLGLRNPCTTRETPLRPYEGTFV
jgi:glycerol-3-phosphate dehydrogenase